MRKKIIALALCAVCISYFSDVNAQSSKNRKSRYYQNNMKENDDFNVVGFTRDDEKKEVDEKPKEKEYDVTIRQKEDDSKYYNEKRVKERNTKVTEEVEEIEVKEPRVRRRRIDGHYTTYGTYKQYNDEAPKYDKYTEGNRAPVPAAVPQEYQAPQERVVTKRVTRRVVRKSLPDDREVKMTNAEHEYKTTYVKKRYTNLDVLCDDLDLAKIQRPVFKGICSECSRDVDLIITNKNLSSLEKNYQLKQCYMMRDKRIRETCDDDQYKKFLRIKDADEYLVITKDLEQKDGINK